MLIWGRGHSQTGPCKVWASFSGLTAASSRAPWEPCQGTAVPSIKQNTLSFSLPAALRTCFLSVSHPLALSVLS